MAPSKAKFEVKSTPDCESIRVGRVTHSSRDGGGESEEEDQDPERDCLGTFPAGNFGHQRLTIKQTVNLHHPLLLRGR